MWAFVSTLLKQSKPVIIIQSKTSQNYWIGINSKHISWGVLFCCPFFKDCTCLLALCQLNKKPTGCCSFDECSIGNDNGVLKIKEILAEIKHILTGFWSKSNIIVGCCLCQFDPTPLVKTVNMTLLILYSIQPTTKYSIFLRCQYCDESKNERKKVTSSSEEKTTPPHTDGVQTGFVFEQTFAS